MRQQNLNAFRHCAGAAILIAVLALGNLVGWGLVIKNIDMIQTANVVGTYSTSNSICDATYLAFTSQQEFYCWREWEPLAKGTYRQNGNYITITADANSRDIIVQGRELYAYNEETHHIECYRKIEKTPIFINVDFD